MGTFFIADMHFGSPYPSYAKLRGFGTTDEMNDAIVGAWRSRIMVDDTVWVLGDVGDIEVLRGLPGTKHLIFGNDDSPRATFKDQSIFASWATRHLLETAHGLVELVHIPKAAKSTDLRVLHGHTHAQPDEPDPRFVSVSVDKTGWGPISLEEVMLRFAERGAAR